MLEHFFHDDELLTQIGLAVCKTLIVFRSHGTGGGDGILVVLEDVCHRLIHNAEHTVENQHGEQHGKTGGVGVDVLLLIELHLLHLHFLGIVLIFFAQLCKLGLNQLCVRCIFLLLVIDRENDQLCDQGKQDNGNTIITDQTINKMHDPAEGRCYQIN